MKRLAGALLALCILVVIWFILAHIARAAGTVGTGTPGSCTEAALDAALTGGGTVTFNCGGPATILLTSAKDILQNTTINGGDVITLTGNLATRLFRVGAPATSLTLSRITLDRAYYSNGSGGAIWNAGVLTLDHVTVKESGTALQYCGGALLTAGETIIADSTFTGNFAGLGGGAICVRGQPGTRVTITDSFFMSNQALDNNPNKGMGGGLYVEYGTAVVRDSAFLLNAAHLGGAVATLNDSASVTLEGSPAASPFASKMQLNANTASEDGGGIYILAGSMNIHNTVISVNQTPTMTLLFGYGGGIHSHGVLTLTDSVVSSNKGRYGGGVFIGNDPTGASAWIANTRFRNNESGNLGGGLYTNDVAATVTISNSTFSGNKALTGGGLARNNTALNIYDSSFTGNTATAGGGLFLGAVPFPTSGPYVRVQNVTVSGNTATSNNGGGILNSGRAELYSTTIVTNTNGVYSAPSGNTRFRNTVLQNPGFANCAGDPGTISDDGANFATDSTCPLPNANSHTGVGLDPLLGPLETDTPGPTSYHMPLAGSPLINAGFNCPERDQRGALRPDACDIGAVEFGGLLPSPTVFLFLPAVAR
jgi:predicted outer membrane repeat protein